MYYAIIADPFHDRGVLEGPSFPDGVSFIRGAIIKGWVPAATLVFRSNCNDDNPPRHYMGGALPIWSKNLLEAFEAAGVDNLQPFPAVITDNGKGREWSGYFAVNVLGLVAAADYYASRSRKLGERPIGTPWLAFQKLVVDGRRGRDFGLFRLAEDPLRLIVHGRVFDHLRRNAPPGGWGISAEEVDESA